LSLGLNPAPARTEVARCASMRSLSTAPLGLRRRNSARAQAEQISRTEQTARRDNQDDDKDDERKPVGGLRVDHGVGAFSADAQQKAAEHRRDGFFGSPH